MYEATARSVEIKTREFPRLRNGAGVLITATMHPEFSFPLRKESDLSTMDWATSAVWRANNRRAAGIFSYTQSGNTARDLAHMLPYRPIFAITSSEQVLAKLALYRNVYPILVERMRDTFDVGDLKELVQEIMERFEIGCTGDQAFAMMAHPIGHEGKTHTLVQVCVESRPRASFRLHETQRP